MCAFPLRLCAFDSLSDVSKNVTAVPVLSRIAPFDCLRAGGLPDELSVSE